MTLFKGIAILPSHQSFTLCHLILSLSLFFIARSYCLHPPFALPLFTWKPLLDLSITLRTTFLLCLCNQPASHYYLRAKFQLFIRQGVLFLPSHFSLVPKDDRSRIILISSAALCSGEIFVLISPHTHSKGCWALTFVGLSLESPLYF